MNSSNRFEETIRASHLRSDALSLAMTVILILALTLTAAGRFSERCDRVRGDTLRLHIVANSDSEIDQRNKLLVRDALLAQYSELLGAAESEAAAVRFVEFLREDITRTAQKALREQGDSHEVTTSVTEMYFDTRTYDDGVTLPAGTYAALRVVIGAGNGHNWWCVMYPPLCIPAATAGQAAETEARIEALSASPGYEARFAVVEWVEKLRKNLKADKA